MSAGNWIAVGYGVVALLSLRPVAGAIAWHEKSSRQARPEGEDWVLATIMGLIACGLWPLIFGAIVLLRVGPFRSAYERDEDLKVREREQAERIRELEREAGIR